MRNTLPLEVDFAVDNNVIAVIIGVELVIKGAQGFGGKAFTALSHLVSQKLKFREHCLAVKGGAELLQEVVYKVSTLTLVGGLA